MWRGTVSQLHELTLPEDGPPAPFGAEVAAWSLGPLAVAGGVFSARRMTRGPRLARRLGVDHYRLLLPMEASTLRFAAGEARRVVAPGQVIFSDLARPEAADCGPGELMQFIVARDVLDALMPRPSDLHGLVPEGPLAGLVVDHLRALVRRLPELSAEEARRASEASLRLIAAVAQGGAGGDARPAIEAATRRRITRHIEAHLTDPELSQETLRRRFGLSRSALYRLFQPLGGVAAYVQERRLRRIHAILSGPGRHHLGTLSWQHGFASQAHMSRSFRALFGHAPRDTEQAPAPLPAAATRDRLLSFEPILRRLDG
ncbi:MAG: hypothetical protein DI556_08225 [Rhodovulum sulfidophilum]|uniref:HTH araC/xylS-type domain-containing protein n=1 Tax=Rhodovulum sulfidophilum TaxID=35806 RepID=A0A2W5N999_RHOSU|nr:MAG: hypothetical protein DI556_08225 [Rhodovulum sulfidophilum]